MIISVIQTCDLHHKIKSMQKSENIIHLPVNDKRIKRQYKWVSDQAVKKPPNNRMWVALCLIQRFFVF